MPLATLTGFRSYFLPRSLIIGANKRVAAEMSFSVGVGDVLAVSRLAHDIWSRLRDSSDQFSAIQNE